jgi:shikimate kinase
MRVFLVGMIGSGKTALGERLAAHLGLPFHDLDREMDRELGRSFHDLVRGQGWLPFRELEYRLVKRFVGLDAGVFSLGGGTVRYEWNRDLLRGHGLTVLLEADLPALIARVRTADRPRVNPGVSLEGDVARIWKDAAHLYRAAADLVYRTDSGRSVDDDATELAALLRARV